MADQKKGTGRRKKPVFKPEELKLRKRFLASSTGKLMVSLMLLILVVLVASLIAGRHLSLFLLLIGIALLVVIAAFWFFLLYRHAVSRD